MEKGKHKLFNRRNFIRTGILGAASSYAYARFIEPTSLSVTEKEIHIPHLPDSLDGLVVAQLTDFHYEPDRQDELIKEAVEVTNNANPDIIALTGDFITDQFPVSLQLSGHTHGGQCRVPFIGYAPVTVSYGRNYIYGEYAKGDSRIFVSRGLGTVGTPVRFACRPEVAILTLRSK